MNESEISQSTSNEKPDIVVKEGERANTTESEVKQLYDELGIKAPTPSGKAKGRPKASSVRAKDGKSKDTGSADNGEEKDADDKSKSKNAPASNENGDSGDEADEKGAKKRTDSGKVSDESEEADKGVRESESKGEEDSERRGEGDSETRDDDAEEKDDQEKGKRPGKSNPEVERRIQRLANESRAKDERIAELERQIQQSTQEYQQSLVAQQDPEYTLDDFRRVRDEEGNILDLDQDQAELAYRRWQDDYRQRQSEREAQYQHEQAIARYQQEAQEKLMQSSVEAYDTLNEILESYPELQQGEHFDQEFSDAVMPLIEETIIYQDGTEPGNPDGNTPVIIGMRVNPQNTLKALKQVRDARRSLPLNGLNDSVETRSNVSVPHSRSSDPTVNAANDLYRELGINKRI